MKLISNLYQLFQAANAQMQSMGVFSEFWAARKDYVNDGNFWRTTLLNMQNDTGNEASECITTWDEFNDLYQNLTTQWADDASYLAGLAEKGQANGTSAGFAIAKGQAYIDMGIMAVNLYNFCDGMYYLQAVSKAVGSSSGAVNQGLNLFYRFFSEEDAVNYYNMSVGIMESDTDAVAIAMGTFLKRFLMVDIPEVTTESSYSAVGSLM